MFCFLDVDLNIKILYNNAKYVIFYWPYQHKSNKNWSWVNYVTICRTAPATPGQLIKLKIVYEWMEILVSSRCFCVYVFDKKMYKFVYFPRMKTKPLFKQNYPKNYFFKQNKTKTDFCVGKYFYLLSTIS